MKRLLTAFLVLGVSGLQGCIRAAPEEEKKISLEFLGEHVEVNRYGGGFVGTVVEIGTLPAISKIKRVVVEREDGALFNTITTHEINLAVGEKVWCDYLVMRSNGTGGTLEIRFATPLGPNTQNKATSP